MPDVRSCGVIVFRREPLSFLLMRHVDRWDLPKGHVDPGETDVECALRELHEETGISAADIERDESFVFETHYPVRSKTNPNEWLDKTLVIYLGWLLGNVTITPTEHPGFSWFPWDPPQHIQEATIDPLLTNVADYFAAQ